MTLLMDMPGIVCASCNTPIPEGTRYSQDLLTPDLVLVVCADGCSRSPSSTDQESPVSDRYGAGRVPRRRNYISGDACLIVGVVSGVIGTWRDNTQTIVSGIWCLALWVALELRFGRQP